MRNIPKGLVLLSLLVGGVSVAAPVWAEGGAPPGVTVSPATKEVDLRTTGDASFDISIGNNTNFPMTFRLSELDFGSLDESGGVAFSGAGKELDKQYSLAAWIHPERDALTLQSGETQSVRVVVENSPSLGPGGHYGAVMFTLDTPQDDPKIPQEVAIEQLFSALIFVKKEGGGSQNLLLQGQDIERTWFRLPEKEVLHFRNDGNMHVTPRGTVVLTDPRGAVIAKGVINESSTLIMPGTERVYPVKLKFLTNTWLPGKYSLRAAYRFDGREDFMESTATFVFVPPNFFLGCLVVSAAAGGTYVLWHSRKRRKKPPAG